MPVVAASWLEGGIRYAYLLCRYRREVAVSGEVCGIGCVGLADREYHTLLKGRFGIGDVGCVSPYVFVKGFGMKLVCYLCGESYGKCS